MKVPNQLLRAESVQDDLYKAINEVKDDMQRQLKKYKEKSRNS